MKKSIAVFGAGKSGLSVSKLIERENNEAKIFDEKLNGYDAFFNEKDIKNYDTFIFSPGFNKYHKWRKLLRYNNNVYSELGFAASKWKGKIIGITGTNGKTSVTKFLSELLNVSGYEAYAIGNIGYPFSDIIHEKHNNPKAIAVCEISSFQAELNKGILLDGFIWTNFHEDHLDTYKNKKDYFMAKLNLLDSLKVKCVFCIGEQLLEVKDKSFWDGYGASVVPRHVKFHNDLKNNSVFRSYPQSLNFKIVELFSRLWGLPKSTLVRVAKSYKLEPYRLNKIYDSKNLRVWEDSKSTNLNAVLAALKGRKGNVYWIGGGKSKGISLEIYAKSISPLIVKAFIYGEIAKELKESFLNINQCVSCSNNLYDSLKLCLESINSMDEVDIVFSPGFSSLDQYSSYKDRGKFFISSVFSLLN